MKRMILLTTSVLLLHVFSGCKKELEDGGISVSFTGNQPYEYTNLYVTVSNQPNAEPIKKVTTTHIEDEVKITGLTPGTYYWWARIDYKQPQGLESNYTFYGKIDVEKGKLMRITLEN